MYKRVYMSFKEHYLMCVRMHLIPYIHILLSQSVYV